MNKMWSLLTFVLAVKMFLFRFLIILTRFSHDRLRLQQAGITKFKSSEILLYVFMLVYIYIIYLSILFTDFARKCQQIS